MLELVRMGTVSDGSVMKVNCRKECVVVVVVPSVEVSVKANGTPKLLGGLPTGSVTVPEIRPVTGSMLNSGCPVTSSYGKPLAVNCAVELAFLSGNS